MLTIKNSSGKTRFILFDSDSEPISIDEIIIRETEKKSAIKIEEDQDEDQESPTTNN